MDSKGGRHRRVESLGTTNHTNKSVVSIEEDLHSRSQNNTASYQPWRQVVRGDSTYSKVMGSQYSDYSDTYAPTVTSFSYSERGSSHSGLRSEEWGADVQFSDYSEHDDSEFPSACELAQTHAASEGLTLEGLREVISESLVDGPNRSKRLNLPAEVQKIIEEDAKYFFGTASVDSHGTEETALDSSRATVEGSDASGALPDPVEEYDHGGDDARSGEPLDKKREPKYEAFDSVGAKWKSWFLGNDFPIDATPEEKLDLYFRKRAVAWKPMKQFEANSFAISCVIGQAFYGWNMSLDSTGYGGLIIGVIIGALLQVVTTLCLTELAGAIQVPGGLFGYSRAVCGDVTGFLSGASDVIRGCASIALSLLILSNALATIVATPPHLLAHTAPLWWLLLCVLVCMVLITGVTRVWKAAFAFVLLSSTTVAVLSVVGAYHLDHSGGSQSNNTPSIWFPNGAVGVLHAILFGVFRAQGPEMALVATHPEIGKARKIPRYAVRAGVVHAVIATALITCFQTLVTTGLHHLAMAPSPAVALLAFVSGHTHESTVIVLLPGMCALAASVQYTARVAWAMARAGFMPRWLAITTGTGLLARTVIAAVVAAYILCLALYYGPGVTVQDTIEFLVDLTVLCTLVTCLLTCVTYFLFSSRLRDVPRTFRSPAGRIGAGIGAVLSAAIFVGNMVWTGSFRTALLVYAVTILVCWIPYFLYLRLRFMPTEDSLLRSLWASGLRGVQAPVLAPPDRRHSISPRHHVPHRAHGGHSPKYSTSPRSVTRSKTGHRAQPRLVVHGRGAMESSSGLSFFIVEENEPTVNATEPEVPAAPAPAAVSNMQGLRVPVATTDTSLTPPAHRRRRHSANEVWDLRRLAALHGGMLHNTSEEIVATHDNNLLLSVVGRGRAGSRRGVSKPRRRSLGFEPPVVLVGPGSVLLGSGSFPGFASGSGSRIPVPQLEVSTGSLEQRNSRPRQIERGGTPPRLPLHGIATPLGNEELQSRSNTEARGGAEEKNAAVETGSEIMLEVDRRSVKEGGVINVGPCLSRHQRPRPR
eukprot:Colp12_sorted_trinity150504_noHs@23173